MKNKGLIFFGVSLGVAVVVLSLGYYFIFRKSNIVWKEKSDNVSSQPQFFSALDGAIVDSAEKMGASVVGVMIDNHPDARPQSGLNKAKIVYEAIAEGGITRLFAVFDSHDAVKKVGPVRSARPYFIDWLSEYSGMYMHCGGSPDGLLKIQNDKVFDLDEMKNGQYFWRDDSKGAPHNLFTSSDLWSKSLSKNSSKEKIFNEGWKFGQLVNTNLKALSIDIVFNSSYMVGWIYDDNSKVYSRYVNGLVSRTDSEVISANNILVQFVKMSTIDDYGRQELDSESGGEARLLRDGSLFIGSWKRIDGRTRFFGSSGEEMVLSPGRTWVEVVPLETVLKTTP